MLKYLIVQLCDSATSFCYYENRGDSSYNLISFENLKSGILWAMKENLVVQFVYPKYKLPQKYYDLIDSVEHVNIKSNEPSADIPVYNGVQDFLSLTSEDLTPKVLRLSKKDFFDNVDNLLRHSVINIVITDIHTLTESEQDIYKCALQKFASRIVERVKKGEPTHVNLLTTRVQLSSMCNCNAGNESITLAPDGNFYICPAFYFDKEVSVGNPNDGLSIPNPQLYKLDYSPICRKCDSFQCKRCVWLNKITTQEINIPSHEQCVAAHIERNMSKELLDSLKECGMAGTDISIAELDYLDPFDKF